MTPTMFFQVLDRTWPAAFAHNVGPWTIREGQGGGQRVSAATADRPWSDGDIALAETAMAGLGQQPLFLIRGDADASLDAALHGLGYRINDPVTGYGAALRDLADDPLHMATFPHWPPLGITADLWAEAGIGPARLAVMARVAGAKTAILGRHNDRAAGVAFVACDGPHAMLHALEVTPAQRRQGVAQQILRAAVQWAGANGAEHLSLAVTSANTGARKLYASFGLQPVGQYHYRVR